MIFPYVMTVVIIGFLGLLVWAFPDGDAQKESEESVCSGGRTACAHPEEDHALEC